MESFSQRITNRRIQLGLTQRQVAMEIGVPLSTYKEWEYGRRVQGEHAYVRLAEALRLNLRTLLTGEKFAANEDQHTTLEKALQKIDEAKFMIESLI